MPDGCRVKNTELNKSQYMYGAAEWVDAEGAAGPTSAPPPLLYTPLLAPDFLTLCLKPKLKLKLKLKLGL
jgi:hypothetical protein